jgi:hypothetical protein
VCKDFLVFDKNGDIGEFWLVEQDFFEVVDVILLDFTFDNLLFSFSNEIRSPPTC